jgi:site-specific DNA-methyltransferase (adenine-specific)
MLELNKIYLGDCLEVMDRIDDHSIDMILCDLPYGSTSLSWDIVIPLEPLWKQYKRVIKDNAAIVLFGSEPFTSILITSKLSWFKYRWDWNKKIPSGMSYARFRPMQQTEDICIFSPNGNKTIYNPQMIERNKPIKSGGTKPSESAPIAYKDPKFNRTYKYKNPTTLIEFQ